MFLQILGWIASSRLDHTQTTCNPREGDQCASVSSEQTCRAASVPAGTTCSAGLAVSAPNPPHRVAMGQVLPSHVPGHWEHARNTPPSPGPASQGKTPAWVDMASHQVIPGRSGLTQPDLRVTVAE